jgi:hypothetical protein
MHFSPATVRETMILREAAKYSYILINRYFNSSLIFHAEAKGANTLCGFESIIVNLI